MFELLEGRGQLTRDGNSEAGTAAGRYQLTVHAARVGRAELAKGRDMDAEKPLLETHDVQLEVRHPAVTQGTEEDKER